VTHGGEPVVTKFRVGTNVLDAIAGELRAFYEARFNDVLTTKTPWHHEYECSSADTYKEFFQGVYPLKNAQGLVLINSLKIEIPMATAPGRDPHPAVEGRYLQTTGLLTQCSNCRRTLRNDGSEIWDWVPRWVSDMPPYTSHSICPTCRDYYWG
jgi:hypothetical protein